ncbi:primosomal protein N' [Candidatus Babeliales bacterium]|nr:primosomal protein N' [Candidatus Babeliales bacterium]
MFIKVKLLKGFPKELFYSVPDSWAITENTIITVPLKNKSLPSVILKIYKEKPKEITFKVREAIEIETLPADTKYHIFLSKISKIYFISPTFFYQRIQQFLKFKESAESIVTQQQETPGAILSPDQQKIVDYFHPLACNPKYNPVLLHGVTGSGKTEVYIKLILNNLAQNKSVILLHPEVSLSIQFKQLLKQKMPQNTPIFSFHSATKAKEKKILWERLITEKPTIIIGIHLPILLPISNLGLIIVDEEHESNYQEKKHPKLNSKEIALVRAYTYDIPILLGSATPSINSINNVKKRNWKLFELKKRFSGDFPKIEKVLLSEEGKRKNFWISRKLEKAIGETLEKKEQVLIFLNRRGYSFFLLCKKCNFVFECPNCSVSLTLHKLNFNQEILKCHYCSHQQQIAPICPSCQSKDFLKKGIGTQQVVGILQKLFPKAKIKRADLDTTVQKREWIDTVKACEDGDIDILVGTQTITKGYHFPKVTLVGVLWADMGLHFPIYNANEIALQQILQVSGRAGRENKHSKVILQIINDNNVFNFTDERDYLKFYKYEMEFRILANYPPICRFAHLELKNNDSDKADRDTEKLLALLEKIKIDKKLNLTLLGPVKPSIFKLKRSEIRQIFIKSQSFNEIFLLLKNIKFEDFDSSIFVVPS